jgi:hypothetical protein
VEAALLPELFVERLALLGSILRGQALGDFHRHTHRGRVQLRADGGPVFTDLPHQLGVEGTIASWDGILRRTLEHRQVRRLAGDLGNRLHPRGAGPDHADALAREGDGLLRPAAGVVALAGEGVEPRDVGRVRRREGADRADQKLGRDARARAGPDRPALRRLVVAGVAHPGLELNVAAQGEPVGDVLEISEHRRLIRLGLGPVPLPHELL